MRTKHRRKEGRAGKYLAEPIGVKEQSIRACGIDEE